MLQLIVLAVVVYFVYKGLLQERRPRRGASPKPPPPPAGQVEEMVQDPACGTWVPFSQALSVRRGNETLHFCSPECRDKYFKETNRQCP